MSLEWTLVHPKATEEHLGYLPNFLYEEDPRTAKEQFDDRYRFGGGWVPFEGFKLLSSGELKYPGDPPMPIVAEVKLRDETIRLYTHSWVVIIQKDGTYEVARMD